MLSDRRWSRWMCSRTLNAALAALLTPGLGAPAAFAWGGADQLRPLAASISGGDQLAAAQMAIGLQPGYQIPADVLHLSGDWVVDARWIEDDPGFRTFLTAYKAARAARSGEQAAGSGIRPVWFDPRAASRETAQASLERAIELNKVEADWFDSTRVLFGADQRSLNQQLKAAGLPRSVLPMAGGSEGAPAARGGPIVPISQLLQGAGIANDGYLHETLFLLESRGWVGRIGNPDLPEQMSTALTPAGRTALELGQSAYARLRPFADLLPPRQMTEFLFDRPRDPPRAERLLAVFTELVELATRDWDLPPQADAGREQVRQQVIGDLTGALVATIWPVLKFRGLLEEDRVAGAVDLAQLTEHLPALQAAFKLARHLGWVRWADAERTQVVFTEQGRAAAGLGWLTGVTASYGPLFSRFETLYFGRPEEIAAVFSRDAGGNERHVDRDFNIAASAGNHAAYESAAEAILLAKFDNDDFANQPVGLMDTGAGAGKFLAWQYEFVKTHTRRGRVLDQYPLKAVAVDLNNEALARAADTLGQAGIPESHRIVMRGDIGKPAQVARELQDRHGIDMQELLHSNMVLLHNAPFQEPGPDDREALAAWQPVSTAVYVHDGRAVPPRVVEYNLYRLLKSWAPYLKHGMMVTELFFVPPAHVVANPGRYQNIAYAGTHLASGQYPVYYAAFEPIATRAGLALQGVFERKFPSDVPAITVNLLTLPGVTIPARPAAPAEERKPDPVRASVRRELFRFNDGLALTPRLSVLAQSHEGRPALLGLLRSGLAPTAPSAPAIGESSRSAGVLREQMLQGLPEGTPLLVQRELDLLADPALADDAAEEAIQRITALSSQLMYFARAYRGALLQEARPAAAVAGGSHDGETAAKTSATPAAIPEEDVLPPETVHDRFRSVGSVVADIAADAILPLNVLVVGTGAAVAPLRQGRAVVFTDAEGALEKLVADHQYDAIVIYATTNPATGNFLSIEEAGSLIQAIRRRHDTLPIGVVALNAGADTLSELKELGAEPLNKPYNYVTTDVDAFVARVAARASLRGGSHGDEAGPDESVVAGAFGLRPAGRTIETSLTDQFLSGRPGEGAALLEDYSVHPRLATQLVAVQALRTGDVGIVATEGVREKAQVEQLKIDVDLRAQGIQDTVARLAGRRLIHKAFETKGEVPGGHQAGAVTGDPEGIDTSVATDIIEGTTFFVNGQPGASSIQIEGPGAATFGEFPDKARALLVTTHITPNPDRVRAVLQAADLEPTAPEALERFLDPLLPPDTLVNRIAQLNGVTPNQVNVTLLTADEADIQALTALRERAPGLEIDRVTVGTVQPAYVAALGVTDGRVRVFLRRSGMTEAVLKTFFAAVFTGDGALSLFKVVSPNIKNGNAHWNDWPAEVAAQMAAAQPQNWAAIQAGTKTYSSRQVTQPVEGAYTFLTRGRTDGGLPLNVAGVRKDGEEYVVDTLIFASNPRQPGHGSLTHVRNRYAEGRAMGRQQHQAGPAVPAEAPTDAPVDVRIDDPAITPAELRQRLAGLADHQRLLLKGAVVEALTRDALDALAAERRDIFEPSEQSTQRLTPQERRAGYAAVFIRHIGAVRLPSIAGPEDETVPAAPGPRRSPEDQAALSKAIIAAHEQRAGADLLRAPITSSRSARVIPWDELGRRMERWRDGEADTAVFNRFVIDPSLGAQRPADLGELQRLILSVQAEVPGYENIVVVEEPDGRIRLTRLTESLFATTAAVPEKRLYFFGAGQTEGAGDMNAVLGGKGAGLAELDLLGIRVPPGFTLTTAVAENYLTGGMRYPDGLEDEIETYMRRLEEARGQRFGDPESPLIVSVRSGARISMPGMLETILNVGLNDDTVEGLAQRTNRRTALDSYRRLIQMFGSNAAEIPAKRFSDLLDRMKEERGYTSDVQLTAEDLQQIVDQFKGVYREATGTEFPQDVRQQLRTAIEAVFRSTNAEKAVEYRRLNHLPDDLASTATVQSMVFGNLNDRSATGVGFTRDKATGENRFTGDFLVNAQGEDVVAGIRTPDTFDSSPDSALAQWNPQVHAELVDAVRKLEHRRRDMQDIEFTVEDGTLYMLQTRPGKRSAAAMLRIASDLVDEGMISKEQAILQLDLPRIEKELLSSRLDLEAVKTARHLGKGTAASPGAAVGRVVFSAQTAAEWFQRGEKHLILVRPETSPEDIGGMGVSVGFLTAKGGATSHAAVVAVGMSKPAVVGTKSMSIDEDARTATFADAVDGPVTLAEGDWISFDGGTGDIDLGQLRTQPSEIYQVQEGIMPAAQSRIYQDFARFLAEGDAIRTMQVWTNADNLKAVQRAVRLGAEGIGLTRTEHMLDDQKDESGNVIERRLRVAQAMLLSPEGSSQRNALLARLEEILRRDFEGILLALDGRPATIRFFDPPASEFLPKLGKPDGERAINELPELMGISEADIRKLVEKAQEVNPMLGLRGVRLLLINPSILRMQTRAMVRAYANLVQQGHHPKLKMMVPNVSRPAEFERAKAISLEEVKAVLDAAGISEADRAGIEIGTMIEQPSAALSHSGTLAKSASFFSFGTNDLTQFGFGLSRDDAAESFLPLYLDERIFDEDPTKVLQDEIAQMVAESVRQARAVNPNLEIGCCGEHGGNPPSIEAFHRAGLTYVSAVPSRVPLARLAAAQAELKHPRRTPTARATGERDTGSQFRQGPTVAHMADPADGGGIPRLAHSWEQGPPTARQQQQFARDLAFEHAQRVGLGTVAPRFADQEGIIRELLESVKFQVLYDDQRPGVAVSYTDTTDRKRGRMQILTVTAPSAAATADVLAALRRYNQTSQRQIPGDVLTAFEMVAEVAPGSDNDVTGAAGTAGPVAFIAPGGSHGDEAGSTSQPPVLTVRVPFLVAPVRLTISEAERWLATQLEEGRSYRLRFIADEEDLRTPRYVLIERRQGAVALPVGLVRDTATLFVSPAGDLVLVVAPETEAFIGYRPPRLVTAEELSQATLAEGAQRDFDGADELGGPPADFTREDDLDELSVSPEVAPLLRAISKPGDPFDSLKGLGIAPEQAIEQLVRDGVRRETARRLVVRQIGRTGADALDDPTGRASFDVPPENLPPVTTPTAPLAALFDVSGTLYDNDRPAVARNVRRTIQERIAQQAAIARWSDDLLPDTDLIQWLFNDADARAVRTGVMSPTAFAAELQGKIAAQVRSRSTDPALRAGDWQVPVTPEDLFGWMYGDYQPLPGALEVLQALKARGVPLGIFTNISRAFFGERVLEKIRTDFPGIFDERLIFTSEAGRKDEAGTYERVRAAVGETVGARDVRLVDDEAQFVQFASSQPGFQGIHHSAASSGPLTLDHLAIAGPDVESSYPTGALRPAAETPAIARIEHEPISDSRGKPTFRARAHLADGTVGDWFAVPAGKSTGKGEAPVVSVDQASAAFGQAMNAITAAGLRVGQQADIDRLLQAHMAAWGGNTTLAVSMAVAYAAAKVNGMELADYIAALRPDARSDSDEPVRFFMNVLNGGLHVPVEEAKRLEIQEFMIVPNVPEERALVMGERVREALVALLAEAQIETTVGDEGGLAPAWPTVEGRNRAAIDLLLRAIERAGYTPGRDAGQIAIALDAAATSFSPEASSPYQFEGRPLTSNEMVAWYRRVAQDVPALISIEDGLSEEDWMGTAELTRAIGADVSIVGDDLFVTQSPRLERGIREGAGNAILIKLNQNGTLSGTLDAISTAKAAGFKWIVSHRSGETEDTAIADLAVGTRAYGLKAGDPTPPVRRVKYDHAVALVRRAAGGSHDDAAVRPAVRGLETIHNPQVRAWAAEEAAFLGASEVEAVGESDYDRLLREAVEAGELIDLGNGTYLARSHPKDTARTESRTIVATNDPDDKGLLPLQDGTIGLNNWRPASEMHPVMDGLQRNGAAGKKLYVIPYIMGQPRSPFERWAVGVYVSPSRYVALQNILMTRLGRQAEEAIGRVGDFVEGRHTVGNLATLRRGEPEYDGIDDRHFVTFAREGNIQHHGSAYGGNALFGKIPHGLRLASFDAHQHGWLVGQMGLFGVEDTQTIDPKTGKPKITYFTAGFPSASGKTNLVMMKLQGELGERYRVQFLGDDIVWFYKNKEDGRVYAINPENGVFGVAPDTNEATNPNAMAAIGPDTGTIFTNVAYNTLTKEIWWEGKTQSYPEDLGGWVDWQGTPITERPADQQRSKQVPWAQPNSRFTTRLTNIPNLSPEWDNPKGVPISGIIWGGRVSSTREPLIRQLRSVDEGVFDGAVMGVETTAAIEGGSQFRSDPMAMTGFYAYPEDQYFQDWRDMMTGAGVSFFHVNWFAKDAEGRFIWPGYGDNLRALLWAIGRIEGTADAVETPVGYYPPVASLNLAGLDASREQLADWLTFKPGEWADEVEREKAYLARLGDRTPAWLREAFNQRVSGLVRAMGMEFSGGSNADDFESTGAEQEALNQAIIAAHEQPVAVEPAKPAPAAAAYLGYADGADALRHTAALSVVAVVKPPEFRPDGSVLYSGGASIAAGVAEAMAGHDAGGGWRPPEVLAQRLTASEEAGIVFIEPEPVVLDETVALALRSYQENGWGG